MKRNALYPALAATAAVLVVAVMALLTHRLWHAEGQRLDAAHRQALNHEVDLALWRLEERATAIAAAPTLWPLEARAPEPAPWLAGHRLIPPGTSDNADAVAYLFACEPPAHAAPQTAPQQAISSPSPQYAQREDANLFNQSLQQITANRFSNTAVTAEVIPAVTYSRMHPRVENGRLTLLRRVEQAHQVWVQEAELDIPAVTGDLRSAVGPQLPQAKIHLLTASSDAPPSRRVAALPFYIDPGPLAAAAPNRAALGRWIAAAWAVVLGALILAGLALGSMARLSQRRGAFVAAVTHEMRTPLTTFRMYTDMLADGVVTDPDQRQSYLHTLRGQSVRLSALVENVLAFARLERRPKTPLETTALNDLIERCLPRLRDRAALDGMTVSSTLDQANDTPVRAAPALVEQILFNLIDNACKYAGAADNKAIQLSASVDDSAGYLTVRDHGPGVRERPDQLFRPFSRSAERESAASPGVGLGLALSRRMARAMGGDLRLQQGRADESGARFVLRLPH